ncbi:MAG: Holliday junction branch migration protein RuvA [Gemmataceae bacterium]
MITKITGRLNRVLDEEARLQVGGFEYQVLVPEFVRRQIQMRTGEELTFDTMDYLEGNPMQGRVVPRLIGFLHEDELHFFDLFCSVDRVGIRKALKALVHPIADVATAIQREDSKWLTTMPGIGGSTADHIIAKLKKKVTRFTVGKRPTANGEKQAPIDAEIFDLAYQAMIGLGHTPVDARSQLDRALMSGKQFTDVNDILQEIYSKQEEEKAAAT